MTTNREFEFSKPSMAEIQDAWGRVLSTLDVLAAVLTEQRPPADLHELARTDAFDARRHYMVLAKRWWSGVPNRYRNPALPASLR